MTIWTKAGLGVAMAATSLMAATPAEAQRYRHYDRGNDAAGAAIVAGIAGLAIGAALTSGNRDRYYDDRRYYYDGPRYRYQPRYRGYDRNYYPAPRYRYRDCRTQRVFDHYSGRWQRVRVC